MWELNYRNDNAYDHVNRLRLRNDNTRNDNTGYETLGRFQSHLPTYSLGLEAPSKHSVWPNRDCSYRRLIAPSLVFSKSQFATFTSHMQTYWLVGYSATQLHENLSWKKAAKPLTAKEYENTGDVSVFEWPFFQATGWPNPFIRLWVFDARDGTVQTRSSFGKWHIIESLMTSEPQIVLSAVRDTPCRAFKTPQWP